MNAILKQTFDLLANEMSLFRLLGSTIDMSKLEAAYKYLADLALELSDFSLSWWTWRIGHSSYWVDLSDLEHQGLFRCLEFPTSKITETFGPDIQILFTSVRLHLSASCSDDRDARHIAALVSAACDLPASIQIASMQFLAWHALRTENYEHLHLYLLGICLLGLRLATLVDDRALREIERDGRIAVRTAGQVSIVDAQSTLHSEFLTFHRTFAIQAVRDIVLEQMGAIECALRWPPRADASEDANP